MEQNRSTVLPLVLDQLSNLKPGQTFYLSEMERIGNIKSVSSALCRLAKDGRLLRIRRGVYRIPPMDSKPSEPKQPDQAPMPKPPAQATLDLDEDITTARAVLSLINDQDGKLEWFKVELSLKDKKIQTLEDELAELRKAAAGASPLPSIRERIQQFKGASHGPSA